MLKYFLPLLFLFAFVNKASADDFFIYDKEVYPYQNSIEEFSFEIKKTYWYEIRYFMSDNKKSSKKSKNSSDIAEIMLKTSLADKFPFSFDLSISDDEGEIIFNEIIINPNAYATTGGRRSALFRGKLKDGKYKATIKYLSNFTISEEFEKRIIVQKLNMGK